MWRYAGSRESGPTCAFSAALGLCSLPGATYNMHQHAMRHVFTLRPVSRPQNGGSHEHGTELETQLHINRYDYNKVLKALKKEFCCNGTVVEDPELGKVIQLQGDQRKNVSDFLLGQKLVKKDQIKIHGF